MFYEYSSQLYGDNSWNKSSGIKDALFRSDLWAKRGLRQRQRAVSGGVWGAGRGWARTLGLLWPVLWFLSPLWVGRVMQRVRGCLAVGLWSRSIE